MAGKVTRRAVGTVVAVVGACLAYAAVAQVKEAVNSPTTLIELWNKEDRECHARSETASAARQAYDTKLRAIGRLPTSRWKPKFLRCCRPANLFVPSALPFTPVECV
jgi:hypothetical protein